MISNKGITPIIATILLLMMVLAVAGSAFFWISRIQNQMQGGTESYQNTLFTQMSSAVNVVGVEAGCSGNYAICQNMSIFFHNTGNTKISLTNNSNYPTTTWTLRDDTQTTRCSTNWASISTGTQCIFGCGNSTYIEVGETKRVILNLSSPCNITTSSDRGKSFSFTVNFAGTTASSSFIVPLG